MNSPRTVYLVIGGLIAIALLSLVGIIGLAANGRPVPSALAVMAGLGGGGIAAILARSQSAAFEDETIPIVVKTRLGSIDKASAAPTPVPESAFSETQTPSVADDDYDYRNSR